MPSNFTIIQYCPDPVADERINIGVMAWDASGAHAEFIETWERVRSFVGGDVSFLREFARSMQRRLSEERQLLADGLSDELVVQLIGSLNHTVQLTPARSASEEAPKLVASMAAQFRYAPTPKTKKVRDRRTAASHAYRAVMEAVKASPSKGAEPLVQRHRTLKGKLGEHRFDVVLFDGKPLAAVSALSFELRSKGDLQREVDATAWALDDLRRLGDDLPLAVFILPPTSEGAKQVFRSASKIFKGLGAKLIDDEAAMAGWATRQVNRLSKLHRATSEGVLAG